MNLPETGSWYDKNVAAVTAAYKAIDSALLHAWLDGLLPPASALVLDVGAGTGRDAAWLAGLGYDVIAVEASVAMRAEGECRHPDASVRMAPEY